MSGIPQNTLGLSASSYLNKLNMQTREERSKLEMRNQSGGNTDLLHEHTPDVYGMLTASRNLSAQKTHQTNMTNTNLRGSEQIAAIQLLSTIASEFRVRLTQTQNGYPDLDINDYCTTQLKNIAHILCVQEGNGQYVFAENSPFTSPINKTAIVNPLPAGSNPTKDYLMGQFSGNTAIRLTKEVTKSDLVMAAHPGVQALVCALRMGIGIDPNQYLSCPQLGSSLDMLTKAAIPQLSAALKSSGELVNIVEKMETNVDFATTKSLENFQNTAREPEALTIQQMLEYKNLNYLQEKIIASASADSQRFSDAILGG